jgi:hypothetical protein
MFNLLMTTMMIMFVIIYVIHISIVFTSSFVLLIFSYRLCKRYIPIALMMFVIICSYFIFCFIIVMFFFFF